MPADVLPFAVAPALPKAKEPLDPLTMALLDILAAQIVDEMLVGEQAVDAREVPCE